MQRFQRYTYVCPQGNGNVGKVASIMEVIMMMMVGAINTLRKAYIRKVDYGS